MKNNFSIREAGMKNISDIRTSEILMLPYRMNAEWHDSIIENIETVFWMFIG